MPWPWKNTFTTRTSVDGNDLLYIPDEQLLRVRAAKGDTQHRDY